MNADAKHGSPLMFASDLPRAAAQSRTKQAHCCGWPVSGMGGLALSCACCSLVWLTAVTQPVEMAEMSSTLAVQLASCR